MSEKAPPQSRGREKKLQALGRQAVSTLYMLVRNVKMYDPANEIFEQPFENLRTAINTVIAIDQQFSLNAVKTTVYLNNKQIQLDFASLDNVRYLTEQFEDRDVGGFSVNRPVQVKELRDFIYIFSADNALGADENGVDGHRLANISVGKFGRIKEQLERIEDAQIEAEQKVDRKKYALTVYARSVYYMSTFIRKMREGGDLPSMQPAAKVVQDLVDICFEQRSHFLGMTTTRSIEEYVQYHSVNTALISIVFGSELGLTRAQLHDLGMAALFHDIGMAEISEELLSRRGGLTPAERQVINLFPLHTVKTLLRDRALDQQMVRRMVASYEAKIDYSKPMRDKDGNMKVMMPKMALGLYGRIINIAATYDALTSARPFREAYGPEVAMTLMVSDMKYKFDPFLLRVFMKVMAIQPVKVMKAGARSIAMA